MRNTTLGQGAGGTRCYEAEYSCEAEVRGNGELACAQVRLAKSGKALTFPNRVYLR